MTELLLAAGAGLASLATPCVYPMVPLVGGYFGRESGPRGRVTRDVALFVAGVVISYTVIGVGLSAMAGATRVTRFAGSPAVSIAVAVVFVVSALALLGVVPVRGPARLLGRMDSEARRHAGAATGSALLGVTFTLATLTCTAPFVGPLLVSAGAGDWRQPIIGTIVYSTALALPFAALAIASSSARRLPRSGAWMQDIVAVVATVQLGAAAELLARAGAAVGIQMITREMVLSVWIALLLALAGYLAGLIRLGRVRRPPYTLAKRIVAAAVPAVVAGWLATGFVDRSLGDLEAFLPAGVDQAALVQPGSGELYWIVDDYRAALATARTSERNVFIDFTGYSCSNCRWMEANVFRSQEVRTALESFVLVRLFTDGERKVNRGNQQLQERVFGTVALPLYAVVTPEGDVLATSVGVTRDPTRFARFIAAAGRASGG